MLTKARALSGPPFPEQVWEGEEPYRELVENANDLIYSIDLQGRFRWVNRAAERVSGYSREEARGMNLAQLVAPEHLGRTRAMMQKALRGEAPVPYDLEIITRHGQRVTLEVSHRLVLSNGLPIGTHAIARDITERRLQEALDRDRAAVLEMIATRAPLEEICARLVEMVEVQDPEVAACAMLLRGERLFRAASRSLPVAFAEAIDGIWTGPSTAPCGAAAFWQKPVVSTDVEADPVWEGCRAAARQAGLAATWSVPIVGGDGRVLGTFDVYHRRPCRPDRAHWRLLHAAVRSATIAIEQRQLTDQLAWQAHHDSLTGLPNRALLQTRLQQAISHSHRAGTCLALLYIDLDRFKLINDTLGHPAGDRVLRQIAARLRSCIRENDTLARISGDEFTIVANGFHDRNGVRGLLGNVLDVIREPLECEGQELFVTASIGVSFFPSDAADAETLMQRADSAMYRAKHAGKNRAQFFVPEMTAAMAERLAVENFLRRALERAELSIHYQPQYELLTGRLVGHEALLRWTHPKLGYVSPARFIPVAEEGGLILPIGAWVLLEACRQAKTWERAGHRFRAVAVNVSAVQLAQPDFVHDVELALEATDLAPRSLEIELTETILMRDTRDFIEKLAALRSLGVRISVDDFGTGYSSLSYLQRLPVDILKLDRSFMNEFSRSSRESSLVRSVVTMAHDLGMRVTAEGVETERQLEAAWNCRFDKVQGFLLGRPRPPAELDLVQVPRRLVRSAAGTLDRR